MTHVVSGSRYESSPIIYRGNTYTVFRSRVSHEIMHLAFFPTGRLTIRPWRSSPDAICGKATQLSAGKSERQLCDPSLVSLPPSLLLGRPPHFQPRFQPSLFSSRALSSCSSLLACESLAAILCPRLMS